MLALADAVRRRITRDQLAPELELDVTPLGDLQRRGDRLRPLRERARHLLVRAQIELVRVEADLRLTERRLRLYAQQCGVMVIVLPAQVMDVAGADQRPAELARDPHDPFVRAVLI